MIPIKRLEEPVQQPDNSQRVESRRMKPTRAVAVPEVNITPPI
jgi:hypothetical protein